MHLLELKKNLVLNSQKGGNLLDKWIQKYRLGCIKQINIWNSPVVTIWRSEKWIKQYKLSNITQIDLSNLETDRTAL